MDTWGASLTWGQACWRDLLGKLGAGGNYLWCFDIVIFMELGRAKRLGDREDFKVIIWGRASHKGSDQFLGGAGVNPLDTMSLSNYYYVCNTILIRKIQHNILHFVNIISHTNNIFIMPINKLTKSSKKLINLSQSATYHTKKIFQW